MKNSILAVTIVYVLPASAFAQLSCTKGLDESGCNIDSVVSDATANSVARVTGQSYITESNMNISDVGGVQGTQLGQDGVYIWSIGAGHATLVNNGTINGSQDDPAGHSPLPHPGEGASVDEGYHSAGVYIGWSDGNTGAMNIYNYGTIRGRYSLCSETEKDQGSRNIFNYGTLDGAVSIQYANFYLLKDAAIVNGNIINEQGLISVGRDTNDVQDTGHFIATNDATAGNMLITNGSQLTLSDGVNWQAQADSYSAVSNAG